MKAKLKRRMLRGGLILASLIVLLWTGTAGAQLAGHPWPMARHDAGGTAKSSYIGPDEPTLKWRFLTAYPIMGPPAIGKDGVIYAASQDGHLYAIRPDGTKKWAVEITTSSWGSSAPALVGHDPYTVNIFDYNGNRLRVLSADDGAPLWVSDDLGDYGRGAPVVGDNGVMYLEANGILYAASQGGIRWRTDDMADLADYVFESGHVVLVSDHIFAYARGRYSWMTNYLYKLNAMTGKVVAQRALTGVTHMAVGSFVSGPTIFAVLETTGTLTRSLTALNPVSLSPLWTKDVGTAPIGPLAVDSAQQAIYMTTGDGKLQAFDFSGARKWDLSLPVWQYSAPIVGGDGIIYVNDGVGDLLHAVSPQGALLWSINVGSHSGPPVIGPDGTIYEAAARGLVAIHQAKPTNYEGNAYLYVHKFMNWTNARTHAQALGGHLVTIGDSEENQIVSDLAGASGGAGDFWIGLSDADREGVFAWMTGEPVDYTAWGPGEPAHDKADKDYVAYLVRCCRIWGVFDNRTPRQFMVEFDGEGAPHVINEDFDDGQADNWLDDGSGVWSVKVADSTPWVDRLTTNGVYQMTGRREDARRYAHYEQDLTDFIYQVDVRKTVGDSSEYYHAYGLRVRSGGEDGNYYWFILHVGGRYNIGKRIGGDATGLVGWTRSPALKKGFGRWNTLKVVARGSILSFYANGVHLATVRDSSLSHGKMGVYAFDGSGALAGQPDTVQFDNVYLRPISFRHAGFLPLINK